MNIKKLIIILFVTSCSGGSSYSWIDEASWTSEEAFVDCLAGVCKVMMDDDNNKLISSSKKRANVGENITVYETNKSTGEKKVITTYRIKGIALDSGRCWLNVKPGESDSFLVVDGCKATL